MLSDNGSQPQDRQSRARTAKVLLRARLTTWWIFYEVEDPQAVDLFEQARRQGRSGPRTQRHLQRALPGWCRAHPLRDQLCRLLAVQLLQQAGASQTVVDEIKARVWAACFACATHKYAGAALAHAFGEALAAVAISQLDLPQVPQAVAARAILAERERALREQQKDAAQLIALLTKLKIPVELKDQVYSHIQLDSDPLVEVLRLFFSIKEGYWRRFFDNRGRERRKKLPNLPTMRERLVKWLCEPDAIAAYPKDCKLSKKEVLDLAAACIKASYPSKTPASLDGESVRLGLQYHKQVASRPVEQRPRYGRM